MIPEMENNIPVSEVEKSVTLFVDQAGKIVINTDAELTAANDRLLSVKKHLKFVDEQLGPAKKKAYDSYQEIMGLIKKIKSPLEKLEQLIKAEMGRYIGEQEKKRREEAARLEKERLDKAASLEKAGDNAGAEVVLNLAIKAPQEVRKEAPKVDGRMFPKVWSAEVVDLRALCAAIAAGTVPLDAVVPNFTKLNGLARIAKDRLNIPGVKAVER
jgi:hypothetical protein